MAETQTVSYASLRPGVPSRAAWNQALVEGAPRGDHLVIETAGTARIDAGFLAALGPVEQERLRHGGSLRVLATDDGQRILFRLTGHDRLLSAGNGTLAQDLSCAASCSEDEIVVRVHQSALQNERLALPAAYGWIRSLDVARLVVDLEQLPHINSVLVAWILQLGQAVKPAVISLRNVSRQVNIQLTQLRLNHVLAVETI